MPSQPVLVAADNTKRFDLLMGVKVGWVLPFYKQAPEKFYTYYKGIFPKQWLVDGIDYLRVNQNTKYRS